MYCFKIGGSPFLIFALTLSQFTNSLIAQSTSLDTHSGQTNPARRRAFYGEFCSSETPSRCDSWMACVQGKCACLEEFVYDPHLGKCVAKAGGRCIFGVPTKIKSGGSVTFATQVAGCVPNAICSIEEDGTCICNNKTYNLEGDCVPSHGHLQHCDSVHRCSQYQGLRCQGGVCDCEIAQSIYWSSSVLNLHEYDDINADADAISLRNQNQSQCVGLAGFPCINSRCTQHAKCTSDNICKCEEGYFPAPVSVSDSDSDTTKDVGFLCEAKLPIFGNCSGSRRGQCGELSGVQLVCIDGKCDCDPAITKYGTAQISVKLNSLYDPFEGPMVTQCLGLVGSPCIGGLCILNANCSYSTSIWGTEQNGTCQCLDSYIESPTTHTCGRGFSSPCTPFSCLDGLVCRNSYCSCPLNTQSYNDSSKSCMSPVGGPCGDRYRYRSGSERNEGPLLTKSTNFSCQANAECRVVLKGGKGPGRIAGNNREQDRDQGQGSHCVCRPGFVENEYGSCKASFGTNCTTGEDCDSNVGALYCTDGTCQCGGFTEYKENIRKCVGLVGAKCDLTLKQECTDNAHCTPGTRLKIPGSCVCNQGFEESSHYTCEASHPHSEGVLINF